MKLRDVLKGVSLLEVLLVVVMIVIIYYCAIPVNSPLSRRRLQQPTTAPNSETNSVRTNAAALPDPAPR